jgi:hypothetical protein
MAQGSLTIQTSGVLSGLALVNAINDALDNLASNASGSTDPSGLTGGVLPYSFWLDTSVSPNILKMRNSANTGWASVGTITGTNFVPNLENADISTALGYTPANKAGDTFTGDAFSGTKFEAPIVKATTKFVFADGSEQATAATAAASAFPTGTVMLFAQTTAPTGWTKSTAHNDKALRIVSGTAGSGGTVAFATAFSTATALSVSGTVGNTTLTIAQMPNHSHSYARAINANIGTGGDSFFGYGDDESSLTGTQGGGGAHNHGFSGSGSVNINVQYVDVILAVKN